MRRMGKRRRAMAARIKAVFEALALNVLGGLIATILWKLLGG